MLTQALRLLVATVTAMALVGWSFPIIALIGASDLPCSDAQAQAVLIMGALAWTPFGLAYAILDEVTQRRAHSAAMAHGR